jgi:two-component system, OmpR family, sensor histidine kinase SaeS
LSHSVSQPLGSVGLRAIAFAAAFVIVASAVGLATVMLLMEPPTRELVELAVYFIASGSVSLAAGWLILRGLERWPRLSLRRRAVIGAGVGGAVALLNVLVVAQLMFIDTGHDLPLLSALVLFGGIASLSVSVWAASAVTARVEDAAAAVRRLASGNLTAGVDETGPRDELHQLARDVNTLAVRLREADEQRSVIERERRDLTAAISHDLRTPLASIRAMVEALADGVVTADGEVVRYYGRLKREVDRLDGMIDDLFELAQLDAGALQLNRQPLAIQEIALEVVDGMRAAAAKADVSLTLGVEGHPPQLAVDGARLERVVANLVRNAIEHTPAGGSIAVAVSSNPETVAVEVTDSGGGIAQEELPHIWDRFYRADKSRMRTQSADGAGLGLAIVRGFVEAHGGTVGVRSEVGEGATFRIELPSGV